MDLVDIDKVLDEFEAAENAQCQLLLSSAFHCKTITETTAPELQLVQQTPTETLSANEEEKLSDYQENYESQSRQINMFVIHLQESNLMDNAVKSFDPDDESHCRNEVNDNDAEAECQSDDSDTNIGTLLQDKLESGGDPDDLLNSLPDFNILSRNFTDEELEAYLNDIDVNDADISELLDKFATETQDVPLFSKVPVSCTNSDMPEQESNPMKLECNEMPERCLDLHQARFELSDEEQNNTIEATGAQQVLHQNTHEVEESQSFSDNINLDAPSTSDIEIRTGDLSPSADTEFTDLSNSVDQPKSEPACEIAVESCDADDDQDNYSGHRGQLVTIKHISDEISDPWKPTESELQLGQVQPVWIPDQDSQICMLCEVKFTLIKRRHHCRACGRVLCAECCNIKRKLSCVEGKDVRVCTPCNERLEKIDKYRKDQLTARETPSTSLVAQEPLIPPDPDNAVSQPDGSATPVESVLGQSPVSLSESNPPDPSFVDNNQSPQRRITSAIRQGSLRRESKRVVFSDGIKPGFGTAHVPESPKTSKVSEVDKQFDSSVVSFESLSQACASNADAKAKELSSFAMELDQYSLYPVIKDEIMIGYLKLDSLAEYFNVVPKEEHKNVHEDSSLCRHDVAVVTFGLKRNLNVSVRRINYPTNSQWQTCWCFASSGLKNVCADEVLIVLSEEPPRPTTNESAGFSDTFRHVRPKLDDVLRYFEVLYEVASKGKLLSDMAYVDCSESRSSFLGRDDNAGFLLFRPTFQCQKSLLLPDDPFLVGLLVKKSESPWAKVLPLRLALRLGIEYNEYPYPLISYPDREPVIIDRGGNTIMNLLNDFRNFTYAITYLTRTWVTLQEKDQIVISIPKDQLDKVQKIVDSSNDHVIAFASSFCKKADSHLACLQNSETGSYLSRTINRHVANCEKGSSAVIGCTFVIFNASFKTGTFNFRTSIVEDGLMIQMKPDMLLNFKERLAKKENIEIHDSDTGKEVGDETLTTTTGSRIIVQWADVRKSDLKIYSAVDNRWLGDCVRFRLSGRNVEVSTKQCLIRLISLFILPSTDEDVAQSAADCYVRDPPDDLNSVVKRVATCLASALLSRAYYLAESHVTSIGLRFSYGSDLVGYTVGLDGRQVSGELLSVMDDYLVPVLSTICGSQTLADESDAARNRYEADVELMLRFLHLS